MVILLLLWSGRAQAAEGVWGSRGVSRRFVARSNRIYAADGRGIAMYDVSDPARIRRLSVAETDSESIDLALIGDGQLAVATRTAIDRYAIAGDGTLTLIDAFPAGMTTLVASNGHYLAGATPIGIMVWDVEQNSLVIRTRFPVPAAVTSMVWHGDFLLAGIDAVGIEILDVSGARETAILPENARDLAIDGDTLYSASGVDGLAIFDLSDITAPRLISRTAAGEVNLGRIAVSGSRAYGVELPDKIDVFDVSMRAAPSMAASIREPAHATAAFDARLFVAGSIIDAYGLTTETGIPLRVYDTTLLNVPRIAGEFRDLGGPVSGVATDGTLAYVIDRPYLRVIDISTTAAPRELASLRLDEIGDRVRLQGTRLIVYGRGDVQLIDVGNPYAPRPVAVFHSLGRPPSNAAFIREAIVEGNPASGFHVIDFTANAQPAQIGGIRNHYTEIVANGGDMVYGSLEGGALVTIDASDERSPQYTSITGVSVVRADIAAATERHPGLLIATALDGLHIFSLADARVPQNVSFLPMPADAVVAADRDIAYSAMAGQVMAVDLTDPAHPAIRPTTMRPIAPMQIATSKGKIVVADRYALRVYGPDTAPPAPPPPPPRRRSAHR